MVTAAFSVLDCGVIGRTLAKLVSSSLFLFGSGVLGFWIGYMSLLDLTSCCTPLDDTTPLL